MGYALKIQDVNFSSVAVDQVTYIVPIPCTGIALNTDTITVERAEGTSQLTATLTPNDTTDHVTWTSSNENVATVSSTGLVTVHGIGTATITATCGEQTATASVTQTTIKAQYDFTYAQDKYPDTTSSEPVVIKLSTTSNQRAYGQAYKADDTSLHIWGETDIECIRVPYGATKMFFAVAEGTNPKASHVYIANTQSLVEKSGNYYPEYSRYKTSVYGSTGISVEYGECFVMRALAAEYVNYGDYAYFT